MESPLDPRQCARLRNVVACIQILPHLTHLTSFYLQWRICGSSQAVAPIYPSTPFNFAYLVEEAVKRELQGPPDDDLELALDTSSMDLFALPHARPCLPTSSYRNRKRKLKRIRETEVNGHVSTERTLFEHVQLADPMETHMSASTLPTAAGAYSALRLTEDLKQMQKEYTLEELLDDGFELIEWNGRCAFNSYDFSLPNAFIVETLSLLLTIKDAYMPYLQGVHVMPPICKRLR